MASPSTTEPVRRPCDECGSWARTVETRRNGWLCGGCLADLRLSAAKAFVHPRDVAKVTGQMRLL